MEQTAGNHPKSPKYLCLKQSSLPTLCESGGVDGAERGAMVVNVLGKPTWLIMTGIRFGQTEEPHLSKIATYTKNGIWLSISSTKSSISVGFFQFCQRIDTASVNVGRT